MTPWWAALAPLVLPVTCSEQNHEIRWADGVISAPAHPDIERERALSALGADPAPCVQIVDAWSRHADDLDVLILASRGPGDRLDEAPPHLASHRSGHAGLMGYSALTSHMIGAYASRVSARPAAMGWTGFRPMGMRRYVDDEGNEAGNELLRLLSLGSALSHRLAATVIATWAEQVETDGAGVAAATPALDAALYGRVRAALLPWLGKPTTIQFTMQPPDAEPALHRDGDTVDVELPFAWLRDVWANGLAIVLDRFCLHAQQNEPGKWTLTTVDRDLTVPHTVTISG